MTRLERARIYREAGFNVIPIPLADPAYDPNKDDGKLDGKKPVISWKTYQQEFIPEESLERLFAGDGNIAIVCGKTSGGLYVIDFDRKKDAQGNDIWTFETFLDLNSTRPLPLLTLSQTGGGGCHGYFRWTGPVEWSSFTKFYGGEWRREGNFVIAPGSRHWSGNTYRFVDSAGKTLARIPRVEDLPEIDPASLQLPGSSGKQVIPPTVDRIPLTESKWGPVSKGERHSTAVSLAGHLLSIGVHPGEATHILLAWNRTNIPPLPEGEITRIVHDLAAKERAKRPVLRFRTAREIAGETPKEIDWIAKPWLAAGTLVLVEGKAKRAGKTTWVLRMVRAILDGASFMGQPTSRCGVMYLTEERDTTLVEALRRAGLLEREDLVILSYQDTFGMDWLEKARQAVEVCRERGCRVLVVDTLPQFAGLSGDQENNPGDALAAVEPLQLTGKVGIAVVAIRHERKSGGDVGDSGRGSSAFTGAADVVVSIRRAEGAHRKTIRLIETLSRFTETPESLMVELTEEGFVSLGSREDVALAKAEEGLEKVPCSEGEALKMENLVELLGGKRTTVQEAVKKCLEAGKLVRVGTGKKGDAYRYYRSVHSAVPGDGVPAERNEPAGGAPAANSDGGLASTGPAGPAPAVRDAVPADRNSAAKARNSVSAATRTPGGGVPTWRPEAARQQWPISRPTLATRARLRPPQGRPARHARRGLSQEPDPAALWSRRLTAGPT